MQRYETTVGNTSPGNARRRGTPAKLHRQPRQGRPATEIHLTPSERQALNALVNGSQISNRIKVAAQIILACSNGEKGVDIAQRIGVTTRTVSRWRVRFVAAREKTLSTERT